MRYGQILHIFRGLPRSHRIKSSKIGRELLGHFDDAFLSGQLVLIAKNVFQIDAVIKKQIWTFLGRFGQNWTSLESLDKFRQVWTSLDQFRFKPSNSLVSTFYG